jgi:predicted adenine nucleotide alpha hydrolase (AANH) superfamily ATPase
MKSILVHICCAPCATAVARRLRSEGFEPELFFFNPNLHPPAEHALRLGEAARYAREIRASFSYDAGGEGAWREAVRRWAARPEGGERCEVCFRFRLERTAAEASRRGIGAFTTTLSLSPHKSFTLLLRAGRWAAERMGPRFWEADFKKKDGFRESVALSQRHGLRRQDYCGCRYSLVERENRRSKAHTRVPVVSGGFDGKSNSGTA